MLAFSERAKIALETTPVTIKAKIDTLLDQLDHGRSTANDKPLRLNEKDVWVIRVDQDTRLFYAKNQDEITILDILDARKYAS